MRGPAGDRLRILWHSLRLRGPRRPDFLIIGAQKGGSTWILDMLRQHPQIFVPDALELMHFNRRDCEEPNAFARYLQNFREAGPGHRRVGEKTPGYFWTVDPDRSRTQPPPEHNPAIPESVARMLGTDLRLIVSLRHPVSRAISAYGHHAARGLVRPNQHFWDVAHRHGIIDMGFYDAHLRAWERPFDPSRFMTLIFERDIVLAPQQTYERLCRFLGVRAGPPPSAIGTPSNANATKRFVAGRIDMGLHGVNPVRPSDVRRLLDIYQQDMAALALRFGRRLEIWDEETAQYEAFASRADPDLVKP